MIKIKTIMIILKYEHLTKVNANKKQYLYEVQNKQTRPVEKAEDASGLSG